MIKDIYGRSWNLPKKELCPICKQPDSCGDCNHKPLLAKEAGELGAKMPLEMPKRRDRWIIKKKWVDRFEDRSCPECNYEALRVKGKTKDGDRLLVCANCSKKISEGELIKFNMDSTQESERYQAVEISVVRKGKKLEMRPNRWGGEDKLILLDVDDTGQRELDYWLKVAGVICEALNLAEEHGTFN